MRIIVGISGASGVVMGYEMLKALRMQEDCEIHLVITQGAIENFKYETDMDIKEVMKLADYCYDDKNMAASISSGSFRTDGMIVIPCSMKTVSAIANGYGANLLVRAVDVCIKESRRVVLVPREMPLSRIHLDNLKKAADYGCILLPPMLTFLFVPQPLQGSGHCGQGAHAVRHGAQGVYPVGGKIGALKGESAWATGL